MVMLRVLVQTVSFLGTDGHVAECISRSRLCVVSRYRWSCRRVLVETVCRFSVQMVMSPRACLDLYCVSFLGTDGLVAECLSRLCRFSVQMVMSRSACIDLDCV